MTYFLEFLSFSARLFFLSLLSSLLLFDKDVYKKHSDIFLYLHLEIVSGFLKIAICFPLQDDFEYNLLTKNSIVLALPNTILLT